MTLSTAQAHVLVIEDDRSIRDVMLGVLGDEGYRVTCSPDGGSGLQVCEADPPDVIILDLLMPGMDGREFLRRLRASRCDAPVIVVSALSNARPAALEMGAADVLAKPFTINQLVEAVAQRVPSKAP